MTSLENKYLKMVQWEKLFTKESKIPIHEQ